MKSPCKCCRDLNSREKYRGYFYALARAELSFQTKCQELIADLFGITPDSLTSNKNKRLARKQVNSLFSSVYRCLKKAKNEKLLIFFFPLSINTNLVDQCLFFIWSFHFTGFSLHVRCRSLISSAPRNEWRSRKWNEQRKNVIGRQNWKSLEKSGWQQSEPFMSIVNIIHWRIKSS